MTLTDLLVGLALVLVIEGLAYAIAPDALLRMADQVRAMPRDQVRWGGALAAAVGLGLVALLRM